MGADPGARGRRRLLLGAAGVGCSLCLGRLAAAADAAAPLAQPAASAAAGALLDSELVRTGLYLIRGGGGNSLLRLSANGMLLIDGKSPGSHRALMSQVRRISRLSDLPIRVLVLTDHHEEHSGDSAQFLAAHIPIVAQRRALARLALPEAAEASPVAAFDDQRTLRLGGVEVQLKHFGPGCTDGDTVAYFPDMKVVALGDLFTPGPPTPDVAAGGSLVGWAAVLAQVLELDVDYVVPGDGPVVGRDALVAYKDKVDAAVSRARALVAGGVDKDGLMAQWRTDDLGWRFDFSGPALDRFYAELAR